jgi:periplasmic divalent cation tolerance protein
MSEACLILSTAGSPEEAHKIARALVERRLAACVNIVPGVDSVYRWQGAVESAGESLLVIKTLTGRSAAAIAAIRELHSYDLPEAIHLAIDDGSPEYLAWIRDSVGG